MPDAWTSGESYEGFIGRWSRIVAREFVLWLEVERRQRWLDVGCGTGALTQTILELADPASVVGIDPSPAFLETARATTTDARATFRVGDGVALPVEDRSADATVSGLVLNFVPEPDRAFAELRRVTRPGGAVGGYVWDYPGRMDMLVAFWDAVVELDPAARDLEEARRFPLCHGDAFLDAFQRAGFARAELRAIDVTTRFRSFEDYWAPFLGGQGPAPTYVATLDDRRRMELRDRLRSRLPVAPDGSIELLARAWAVRASV